MANIPDNLSASAADYERDGVIRLPGLFSAEQVERIRRELGRYIREHGPNLPERDIVYEADGRSVRNLWRMHEHDDFFNDLATDPQLIKFLTELLHGDPVLMSVQCFNKPAKVGSNIPAHQDNAYFCQSPPDVLTVWIAIDAATTENGPVTYFKGSHHAMLPHEPSGVKGNSMGLAEPLDEGDQFVGTLNSGDALIHHCQTVHESAPNHSDHPRCGLLMVFRGEHTQEDAQLKDLYRHGGALT